VYQADAKRTITPLDMMRKLNSTKGKMLLALHGGEGKPPAGALDLGPLASLAPGLTPVRR